MAPLDPRASPKYAGQQIIRGLLEMVDKHGLAVIDQIGRIFVENKNLIHAAISNPRPMKDCVLDPELLLSLLDRAVQSMIADYAPDPKDVPGSLKRYQDRLAAVRSATAVVELQRAAIEGLGDNLAAIEGALRDGFPHFQDGAQVTVERIKEIADDWSRMTMAPPADEITFWDQDGEQRKIVYECGDAATGPFTEGYTIPHDADWQVCPAGCAGESNERS